MTLTVYIAAPFARASFVRCVATVDITELGARVVSTWADTPDARAGLEDLGAMTPEAIRNAWIANHYAIGRADVILVLADEGRPRETFGELEHARRGGAFVVFLGTPNLTAAFMAQTGQGVVVKSYSAALAEIRKRVVAARTATGTATATAT